MTGPALAGPVVWGGGGRGTAIRSWGLWRGFDLLLLHRRRWQPGFPAAKYVYVRRGGNIPSFEPLYLGPFPVLDYGSKVFCQAVSGKEESVSSRDR
jgi:hypothetical protein